MDMVLDMGTEAEMVEDNSGEMVVEMGHFLPTLQDSDHINMRINFPNSMTDYPSQTIVFHFHFL